MFTIPPKGTSDTEPAGPDSTWPAGPGSTWPAGATSTWPAGPVETTPGGEISTCPGGSASTWPGGNASTCPGGDASVCPAGVTASDMAFSPRDATKHHVSSICPTFPRKAILKKRHVYEGRARPLAPAAPGGPSGGVRLPAGTHQAFRGQPGQVQHSAQKPGILGRRRGRPDRTRNLVMAPVVRTPADGAGLVAAFV